MSASIIVIRILCIVPFLWLTACGGGGGGTTVNTTVVSPVAVSAVFPAEARVGETITISGQKFGATQGTSTLSINGVTATQITSWSDTQIVATLPSAATTGNVTVSVNGVAGAPGYLIVLWQATNPANVAISAAPHDQINPQLTTDGAGGAIVVWQDHRTLTDGVNGGGDIYAQRVNNAGVPQWTADGVAISSTANGKRRPQIVSDGAGGAIIVWTDISNLHAQRIDSSGVPQWGANGVDLGAALSVPIPQIAADGAGGAVIAWEGLLNNGFFQLRIQRLDSAGLPQWTTGGVALTGESGIDRRSVHLLADGAGGTFVVWSGAGMFAQYVNNVGVPQWTANGVEVAGGLSNRDSRPKLTTDGAAGVIVAWDGNTTAPRTLRAQRVDRTGATQWGSTGVTVVSGNSFQVQITTDNAGGAIVGWTDLSNIYVQRLNGAGVSQWTAAGVMLGVAEPVALAETTPLQLIPDTAGGAMIVWEDFRGGVTTDIYAQRVNNAGVTQWANATAVCTETDRQALPQLVADGVGGAVLVWQDRRNGSDYDVYAQGVSANGR